MKTTLKERTPLYPQKLQELGVFEVFNSNPLDNPETFEETWEHLNIISKIIQKTRCDVFSHVDLDKNQVASFFYHNIETYLIKALFNFTYFYSDNAKEEWSEFISHGLKAHIYEDEEENTYLLVGEYTDYDLPDVYGKSRVDLAFIHIAKTNTLLIGQRPSSTLSRIVECKDNQQEKAFAVFEQFIKNIQTTFFLFDYNMFSLNLDVYEQATMRNNDFKMQKQIPSSSENFIDIDGFWVNKDGENSLALPGYINLNILIFYDYMNYVRTDLLADYPEYKCSLLSTSENNKTPISNIYC